MTEVERLEQIAQQLVARMRDDDPEANGHWLAAELPDPQDVFRLCFVLAAAVPDDRSWRQLVAWVRLAPQLPIVPDEPAAGIDEVAVRRAIAGDRVRLTPRERTEVVRQLTRLGWGSKRIAEHLGITMRSVTRNRAASRRATHSSEVAA